MRGRVIPVDGENVAEDMARFKVKRDKLIKDMDDAGVDLSHVNKGYIGRRMADTFPKFGLVLSDDETSKAWDEIASVKNKMAHSFNSNECLGLARNRNHFPGDQIKIKYVPYKSMATRLPEAMYVVLPHLDITMMGSAK